MQEKNEQRHATRMRCQSSHDDLRYALCRMYEEHCRVGMVIDRDGGKILIEAKDRGAYYEFAIADDGSGIAESQRQRIFEMFYTVDNSTSTTNTGIGLALVIIKKE